MRRHCSEVIDNGLYIWNMPSDLKFFSGKKMKLLFVPIQNLEWYFQKNIGIFLAQSQPFSGVFWAHAILNGRIGVASRQGPCGYVKLLDAFKVSMGKTGWRESLSILMMVGQNTKFQFRICNS